MSIMIVLLDSNQFVFIFSSAGLVSEQTSQMASSGEDGS